MKGCKVWLIVVISICILSIIFIISGTQSTLAISETLPHHIESSSADIINKSNALSEQHMGSKDTSLKESKFHLDIDLLVNKVKEFPQQVIHTPIPIKQPAQTLQQRTMSELQLVSQNKPVISDVRGNLGPASCITNETMSDWLTDRWQGKTQLIEHSTYVLYQYDYILTYM